MTFGHRLLNSSCTDKQWGPYYHQGWIFSTIHSLVITHFVLWPGHAGLVTSQLHIQSCVCCRKPTYRIWTWVTCLQCHTTILTLWLRPLTFKCVGCLCVCGTFCEHSHGAFRVWTSWSLNSKWHDKLHCHTKPVHQICTFCDVSFSS